MQITSRSSLKLTQLLNELLLHPVSHKRGSSAFNLHCIFYQGYITPKCIKENNITSALCMKCKTIGIEASCSSRNQHYFQTLVAEYSKKSHHQVLPFSPSKNYEKEKTNSPFTNENQIHFSRTISTVPSIPLNQHSQFFSRLHTFFLNSCRKAEQ